MLIFFSVPRWIFWTRYHVWHFAFLDSRVPVRCTQRTEARHIALWVWNIFTNIMSFAFILQKSVRSFVENNVISPEYLPQKQNMCSPIRQVSKICMRLSSFVNIDSFCSNDSSICCQIDRLRNAHSQHRTGQFYPLFTLNSNSISSYQLCVCVCVCFTVAI